MFYSGGRIGVGLGAGLGLGYCNGVEGMMFVGGYTLVCCTALEHEDSSPRELWQCGDHAKYILNVKTCSQKITFQTTSTSRTSSKDVVGL
jgi:hypothetical protein